MTTKNVTYPEHEKLKAIKDQSQAIGEFIEWLKSQGYYICERRDAERPQEGDVSFPSRTSRRADRLGDAFCEVLRAVADTACIYWPTTKRLPDALLAEYFDINETKLDDEKRAMLGRLRDANAGLQ